MNRQERGIMAETVALSYERNRLSGKCDSIVKYVGDRRGLGFDIQSVEEPGSDTPRFIEVKSISHGGYFFLTERERLNLEALSDSAWLYLVDIEEGKVDQTIQNPLRVFSTKNTSIVYKIKI